MKSIKYWWVNQKQTRKFEILGGYMWSPKKEKGGRFSQFYENMRLVDVGDVVFSYFDSMIQYIGIVTHHSIPSPKPDEFGKSGTNWGNDGWLVSVKWIELERKIKPRDFFSRIQPVLPEKYSPLQRDSGKGLQKLYLASVPIEMAKILLEEIGEFSKDILKRSADQDIEEGLMSALSDRIQLNIQNDFRINTTEKESIIRARIGQGVFRQNVINFEKHCRVTGVNDLRLLRASHIKPWRACENNYERIDGNNELLLSPNIDHLFDNGFISFSNDGLIQFSRRVENGQFGLLGLDVSLPQRVVKFRDAQIEYLEFHRANVFLRKD